VKAQPKGTAAKAKKPAAKAKPAAKSVAKKPAAKAPAKKAAAKAKPAAKPVARKVPAKAVKASKPAAKAKPSAKLAKPVAKKAPAKVAAKAPAKTMAKPVAKAVAKVAAKAVKGLVKAVQPAAPAAKKPVAPPASAPAKAAPAAKAPSQPVPAAPPRAPQAVAPKSYSSPARAAAAYAQAGAATVPTAVKATYIPMASHSVLTPPPLGSVKKDPKLANNWKTKDASQLSDAEVMAMPDSEYMNDKQMAFFRLKLQQLKTEILNSAGETTEHLREDTVVVPDPADRATIEEEHALELRTRDRERKLLKKIEQSIGRIDAGDYGYCDETGEPIGVGRLLARPTATLSLEAQQRRELKQKMFGD
jgi:DnaK suppressor protein